MLAKKYNGEIINADSMQIYKKLNIGTAKITEEEKENIKHHLLDIKNIDEYYSIFEYQKDCRNKIKKIQNRNKTVIIVGGTGLYLKSALYDYNLKIQNEDKNLYESKNTTELYNLLKEIDPKTASKIDKNNKRRLINAIIYYKQNKKSIIDNKTDKLLYDTIFIGLTTSRENLYDIINKRVDKMVEAGLIEEVKYFYNQKQKQ